MEKCDGRGDGIDPAAGATFGATAFLPWQVNTFMDMNSPSLRAGIRGSGSNGGRECAIGPSSRNSWAGDTSADSTYNRGDGRSRSSTVSSKRT